jgi:hypothetical protein
MKSLIARVTASLVLALVGWMMMAGAANAPILQPDKLIILSTTDVKGKTSPCG